MLAISLQRNIIIGFITWHFYTAPRQILVVWGNYLSFYWEYFSVPLLLKTLFSPWRGQADSYGRGFDLKIYATVFLGNLVSRFLGAVVRIVVIVIGFLFSLAALIAGLFVLIVWLAWPLLFLFGLATSVYLII